MIVDPIRDGKTAADVSGMTIHISHGHILNSVTICVVYNGNAQLTEEPATMLHWV